MVINEQVSSTTHAALSGSTTWPLTEARSGGAKTLILVALFGMSCSIGPPGRA